jgi:hypothetical protein
LIRGNLITDENRHNNLENVVKDIEDILWK